MAKYTGIRMKDCGHLTVYKDDERLLPERSQKVWNHSPDGFQWGYAGSGPAQLALALLLDVTNNDELSTKLHQKFKFQFVTKFGDVWSMTSEEINNWVSSNEQYAKC